jgi:pimeloyl-ACP methyl ester carboxylesterase
MTGTEKFPAYFRLLPGNGPYMSKPVLIILHGALGAATPFDKIKSLLSAEFETDTLDFEGHGKEPVVDRPFRMEHFVENLLGFYQTENLPTANIFGYSMGGYAALLFARQHPQKVNKIFTLGTKFAWNPETAEKEAAYLDPAKIAEKVPAFAGMLAQRHRGDWKEICRKTREMMVHLGKHDWLRNMDLSRLEMPVVIGRGEQDNMVTEKESTQMALQLPNASFQKFPQTQHPIEKVDQAMLATALKTFFLDR